jgi:tetratricopeptide (TPR) repeat protein
MADTHNKLGWVEAICAEWPGPIAHEYHVLRRMFPDSRAQAAKADYTVHAASTQLRDVAELLLKLPVVVMLRDADRLGLPVTEIKGRMLGSPPNFGNWCRWADELARMIRRDGRAWTDTVAGIFRDEKNRMTAFAKLYSGREGLVNWRNRELGHGALRKDLAALAAELAKRVIGLNEQLALVANEQPWRDLKLHIEGSRFPLIGHGSIQRHHDRSAGPHAATTASVICEYSDASQRLDLGPYLAARICRKCEQQDVFFFNGRSVDTSPPEVQYLDYLMGHSLLEAQANDARWADEASHAKGTTAPGSVGDNWIDNAVSKLLDGTNFEREYVPPTYIADEVRNYLARHDRGVVWLRAPAHTGKTVFSDKAADLFEKEPGDLFVATFKIKREYRWGLAAFSRFVRTTFFADNGDNLPLPWESPGRRSLAECFVAGTYELLDRARDLNTRDARVVLIFDGMDELPEPGSDDTADATLGIADLIPKADMLPHGVFLLLTSRPTAKGETPRWVARKLTAALRGQENCRTIDIDRDTPGYRRLLQQVFDKSLVRHAEKKRRPKRPDELFVTVGNRADWTFLHFSHLVRLLRDGVIAADTLTHMKEHGDQLFMAYLRQLEAIIGSKEFDRVRELLLVLAACEEAHVQTARIVPPFFFDADWKGVSLDELTGLLHELSPGTGKLGPRVPLRVLFLLKNVEDILRSYRGDDEYSRHRIGLKGMVAAMRADREPGGWADQLDATHHRLVREAIAAEKAFFEQADNEVDSPSHESYLHYNGWAHARALINLGSPGRRAEAAKTLKAYKLPVDLLIDVAIAFDTEWLSGVANETLSIVIDHVNWRLETRLSDWRSAEVDSLAAAYCNRAVIRATYFDFDGADDDYARATAITERAISATGHRVPWELRYGMAITLLDRGALQAQCGERAKAKLAFEKAVPMFKTLRKTAESAWKPDVDDRLAIAMMNRGLMRSEEGNLAGAREDYDQSITILNALRKHRNSRWDPEVCGSLALVLTKRGTLLEESDEIAGASRDYGKAITLLEECLDKHDDPPSDAFHALAQAYGNRAGLTGKGADPSKMLADYTEAIVILKILREHHRDDCRPEIGDELATRYRNRGGAHADSGHFRKAIADYGRGIDVYEELREELGTRWSPGMTENLAELYTLRADLHTKLGAGAKASADTRRAMDLRR